MINKFLLPLLLLFLFSCSDDSGFEVDELELRDNSEVIEFGQNENQLFAKDTTVAELGGFNVNWCSRKCNVERNECYDWAFENRHYRLLDCERIRIIGTEDVDIFCEETVIVGYDQVEVYSPEGELIRIDDVPIYGVELVLCRKEEQNIYSSDPVVLQEYRDCKAQTLDELADAVQDCDSKYSKCDYKCK